MTAGGRALNRKRRRQHAKALTRADVDIERVIPAPPSPAWDHWWHPTERQWYRHDDRIIRYAELLRAAEIDGCDVDECSTLDARITELLDGLEPQG